MTLRCLFARRSMCVRLGSRMVGWGEPFSRRSGNALAHRFLIPGFPDRPLKGFCTSIRVMNAVVESAPVHAWRSRHEGHRGISTEVQKRQ
jgi:hypothetical protein